MNGSMKGCTLATHYVQIASMKRQIIGICDIAGKQFSPTPEHLDSILTRETRRPTEGRAKARKDSDQSPWIPDLAQSPATDTFRLEFSLRTAAGINKHSQTGSGKAMPTSTHTRG